LPQLNTLRNPAEPDLTPTSSAPIIVSFSAESYNVSVYTRNIERSGEDRSNVQDQAGLAIVHSCDDYLEASLFSKDAHGTLHMVSTYFGDFVLRCFLWPTTD